MTGRGRKPTAAMPRPAEHAYACAPCETETGRKVWIGGFATEAARDDAMLRHYYARHAGRQLAAHPARWIGCGEFECVCGPYGPPCGHPRHTGCVRRGCPHPDGRRLRREWQEREAAREAAVTALAWHLAEGE